LNCRWW